MPTGIDYLDEVWNPITGCSGKCCKANCWAREMVKRFPAIHGPAPWTDIDRELRFSHVVFHPDRFDKPLHWKKPRRVGVCFMGDLFDEQVPFTWVSQLLDNAHLFDNLHHEFLFLTKHPKRMKELVCLWAKERDAYENQKHWQGWILLNWWFGVSITDQEAADRMIPELMVPGKKWISIEPMLGPVDLNAVPWKYGAMAAKGWRGVLTVKDEPDDFVYWMQRDAIQWIVLGCESGPKRRPCPHEWMIDVVRQCKAAGMPVWVKQVDMGNRVSHDPAEWPEELRVKQSPIGRPM